MTTAHTLTFPGLFAPQGLLGAGKQSTAWLYMFWHAGFPLFVIAYARIRRIERTESAAWPWIGGTVLLVAVLVVLSTLGEPVLPPIMLGNAYQAIFPFVVGSVWLCSAVALATALAPARPHAVRYLADGGDVRLDLRGRAGRGVQRRPV